MNAFMIKQFCKLYVSIIFIGPVVVSYIYPKPLELQLGGKGTQPHEPRRDWGE
jgi:hypothetical protein|tara:strand:+ start:70 stop:228 length:159 start_codon:yes stop_codon:yes gene_type:complete